MDDALRALSEGGLRRLEGEPWLHRKRLLAEHAVEDAEPLGIGGGADLAARLDRAPDAAAWQRIAYEEVKPALAAAALARDEPRLIPFALRQERHVLELPVRAFVLPIARDPALDVGPVAPALTAEVDAAHAAARAGDARAAAQHLRRAAELEAAAVVAGAGVS